MNKNINFSFMAFGKAVESKEGRSIKRYIGASPVYVLAVNPTKEERNKYIQNYLEKEKEVYEKILENKTQNIEGKLKDLAKEYGMTLVEFTGFIDGINTSITQEVNF